MNKQQLDDYLRAHMPDGLHLSVVPCTPMYRQLQGDTIRYSPYVVEIRDGYATSAYDNHDTYPTPCEAMQAGLRLIAKRR